VHGATILGDIDLLSDDLVAAENTYRSACEELERRQAYSHLASTAGELAETLYRLGRLDEASEWVEIAERHSATDDVDARVLWMPVRAKLVACGGDVMDAVTLARQAVELAERGDALNRTAKALTDLGEVLLRSGRSRDRERCLAKALDLYGVKGNVVGERRVRAMLGSAIVETARPA
jgi:tetratricopeptide (TPR) repeat protein